MWRKRASPAPSFRQPAPFNPQTGQYAPIGGTSIITRIAMMQVIEEDTHDNYVVCRGYDPEVGKFFNTLNVAKPYGTRGTKPYKVGQVFAAAKPQTMMGETPGVASVTMGHPADLNEEVDILRDDDKNPIAWLDIDGMQPNAMQITDFEMTAALIMGQSAEAVPFSIVDGSRVDGYPITVCDSQGCFSKMITTSGDTGAMGLAALMPYNGTERWEILSMQTPCDFWGKLTTGGMEFGTPSVTVEFLASSDFGGYNVFQSNHGSQIAAYNPFSPTLSHWFAGDVDDRIFCHWDIKNRKYWIMAIEPNNHGWQDVDVVTNVYINVDFFAQTTTKHIYKKTIQLPPSATIGNEFEAV